MKTTSVHRKAIVVAKVKDTTRAKTKARGICLPEHSVRRRLSGSRPRIIVGLTQLGLRINVSLAVPNQGRLDAIISLIEASDFSVHDLSRVESSRGIPRFNMPLELGLALLHSKRSKKPHGVYIFDKKAYQAQRSTSDVNGIDPQIHKAGLRP